jgi:hypothetical protein
MTRFSVGFVTGLVTGLGIAAIVMFWTRQPAPDALLAREPAGPPQSQPEVGSSRAAAVASPERIEARSPDSSAGPAGDRPAAVALGDTNPLTPQESRAVVPVPVHELLEDVLRSQGKDDSRFNSLGPLHRQLENESEDPAWSHYVEWHIRDYLGRQPGVLSKQVEVFLVECRSTLCEIQAFADVADRTPAADWQSVAIRMEREPWLNEFSDSTTRVAAKKNRVTYVTFLARKSR